MNENKLQDLLRIFSEMVRVHGVEEVMNNLPEDIVEKIEAYNKDNIECLSRPTQRN